MLQTVFTCSIQSPHALILDALPLFGWPFTTFPGVYQIYRCTNIHKLVCQSLKFGWWIAPLPRFLPVSQGAGKISAPPQAPHRAARARGTGSAPPRAPGRRCWEVPATARWRRGPWESRMDPGGSLPAAMVSTSTKQTLDIPKRRTLVSLTTGLIVWETSSLYVFDVLFQKQSYNHACGFVICPFPWEVTPFLLMVENFSCFDSFHPFCKSHLNCFTVHFPVLAEIQNPINDFHISNNNDSSFPQLVISSSFW